MRKANLILAMIFLLAAPLRAADVSGTWNAKVEIGGRSGTPTFVLKQDGEKLTGTYSGLLGQDVPVKGTVKDKEVTIEFEAAEMKVQYSGKLNDDWKKMEGTVDYGGQFSGTFTATREEAKEKK